MHLLSIVILPIHKKHQMLAKRFAFADWHFMNYGFALVDGDPMMPLRKTDEIDRYPINY